MSFACFSPAPGTFHHRACVPFMCHVHLRFFAYYLPVPQWPIRPMQHLHVQWSFFDHRYHDAYQVP